MNSELRLYTTIQEILQELRKGGRDFAKYLEWLKLHGLSQGEAEDLLDRLLKQE